MQFKASLARLPWSVAAVAIALIAVGCLGLARSDELNASGGRFLRPQIAWSILAIAVMAMTTLVNYRVLCRWSYVAFGVALLLLAAVYLFPRINGAQRWIRVGGFGFQPSEFTKLVAILALARYLMYRDNFRRLRGLFAPLAITLVPVLLVLKEPDLGTSLVFLPVLFSMLVAAGARWRDLACIAAAGVLVLPILWTQMSRDQRSRVTALIAQTGPEDTPREDTYHLHQAKQMLALGGVGGSWLSGEAVDDRTVYRVPEPHTDSIFCILVERYGLWGAAGVFGLYFLLVQRGLSVAAATREPFGRLVAVGISSLIAVQVMINAGMIVGLLPVVGLSLPLVSYGGSGMLVQGIALGLLLNIGLRPGYEITNEPFRYVRSAAPAAQLRWAR